MPTPVLWLLMMLFQASAAPVTRFADVPASSIGFWRVFGSVLILAPLWIRARSTAQGRPALPRGAAVTGFFLGAHFATWCWALQHTTIANAVLFVGMQPVITPFLGRWMNGDRLNNREIWGTVAACAGMAWILGGQILVTPDQLPGSFMALVSMVCCAFYLSFGRKHRESGNILLFSVPVYAAAAAAQALFALVLDGGVFAGDGRTTWIALAALALIPTVGGHTLTLTLLRRTTAHTVALSVPAQFVLNTIVAVPLFGERPDAWFYPGAALVTAGVLMAILSAPAASRPPETNR